MASYKVFVDGAVGTTGLRIHERLRGRPEIELITLPEESRKDLSARAEAVNSADLSFLCLPDEAARAVVGETTPGARIIDTSTAHRTNDNWVYGFPELGRREAIATAKRVAVPGCHATGYLALAAPLAEAGLLPAGGMLACNSITGYSGGGKQMIAAYEDSARPSGYDSPRLYGLTLSHKHLPEMEKVARLPAPLFSPVVADYYCGMLVWLPLPPQLLGGKRRSGEIADLYARYYKDESLITVYPAGEAPADGALPANALAGRDDLEIFTFGRDDQLLVAARFDNLGKGASGAAVQCMNLMLSLPETQGLVTQ